MLKTWGHPRIIFLLSVKQLPESKMIFANISAKSRPKSKLFHGVNLGPMGYQHIYVKTKVRKSHAKVTLKGLSHEK